MKNRRRQYYFSMKALQISLSIIVLWSFVAAIVIAFLLSYVKEFIDVNALGMKYKVSFIIIIFIFYIFALSVLTSIFTHRFVGPFQRLTRELKDIADGKYHKRLSIRKKDDPYIRSFVSELNRVLDKLEEKSQTSRD